MTNAFTLDSLVNNNQLESWPLCAAITKKAICGLKRWSSVNFVTQSSRKSIPDAWLMIAYRGW